MPAPEAHAPEDQPFKILNFSINRGFFQAQPLFLDICDIEKDLIYGARVYREEMERVGDPEESQLEHRATYELANGRPYYRLKIRVGQLELKVLELLIRRIVTRALEDRRDA